MNRIQILSITGSSLLLVFIIELVRKRKLKVEYSILWLVASIAVVALSIFRPLLDWFGHTVGVYYAPAALFLVAIFFGILLFIHFSTVITKLSNDTTTLAQKIALLEDELKKIEKTMENQK